MESLEGMSAEEIKKFIPVGHTIAMSDDKRLCVSDENMDVAMRELRDKGYSGEITLITHYDPEKKRYLVAA